MTYLVEVKDGVDWRLQEERVDLDDAVDDVGELRDQDYEVRVTRSDGLPVHV